VTGCAGVSLPAHSNVVSVCLNISCLFKLVIVCTPGTCTHSGFGRHSFWHHSRVQGMLVCAVTHELCVCCASTLCSVGHPPITYYFYCSFVAHVVRNRVQLPPGVARCFQTNDEEEEILGLGLGGSGIVPGGSACRCRPCNAFRAFDDWGKQLRQAGRTVKAKERKSGEKANKEWVTKIESSVPPRPLSKSGHGSVRGSREVESAEFQGPTTTTVSLHKRGPA